MTDLKTPLYDRHVALGGRIVSFAGFLLPVQYEAGVIAEHLSVRKGAGLFDVSHMGELRLSGPDALKNIQRLVSNDCAGMPDGRVRYSPMCNEQGGIVDDLIICKLEGEDYLLVVNASNRAKDAAWIEAHLDGNVAFRDESDSFAQIALQGPLSFDIISRLAARGHIPERYYTMEQHAEVSGIQCLLSRTGYTGEDGFELYCAPDKALPLWDALLAAGRDEGLLPCGLGARDTLRLEAAMPLYGHEMNEGITPLEAGLGAFVKMDKGDFIGRQALLAAGAPGRIRAGFEVVSRGIAREGCEIYKDGTRIGIVTSGTHAPYLGFPVAMGLIDTEYAVPGQTVQIDVRGRMLDAKTVSLPFYIKKGSV